MDVFLLLLGFFFIILGIAGAFLPIIPGPLTSWIGLLVLHLTNIVPIDKTFLIVTFIVAAGIWLLDYLIPAIGTKKFGGTKYGVYGTTIGLILGLFSPVPFGILIGAFLGALIGELIYDNDDLSRALKASFGAFIGFIASVTIKFSICLIFMALFVHRFWDYRTAFFG